MAVLGRHYQAVTVLRCTDDGSHFVSGGEDNLVIVWSTARCVHSICVCFVFRRAGIRVCVCVCVCVFLPALPLSHCRSVVLARELQISSSVGLHFAFSSPFVVEAEQACSQAVP